jgi:hypothetical protein
LTNIVTETHFQSEDRDPQGRMGRLIAFLANMANGIPAGLGTPLRGIAASNSTAVDIDPSGSATIVTAPLAPAPFAYFVTDPNPKPNIAIALIWQSISVIRVASGGTFNLGTWTAAAGSKSYKINAKNGLLAVEGNNDIY